MSGRVWLWLSLLLVVFAVIPAKAGNQFDSDLRFEWATIGAKAKWIPACAGMTNQKPESKKNQKSEAISS